MVKLLLKCSKCNSYTFNTLPSDLESESEDKKICPICQGTLVTPHPPKYSMDNKYRKYVRALKKEIGQ